MKRVTHYRNSEMYIDKEIAEEYIKLKEKADKINAKLKELESQIKDDTLKVMESKGIYDNFKSNGLKITYTSGYTKMSLDTTRLKNDDFDLYTKYLKTSNVSESLKIGVE